MYTKNCHWFTYFLLYLWISVISKQSHSNRIPYKCFWYDRYILIEIVNLILLWICDSIFNFCSGKFVTVHAPYTIDIFYPRPQVNHFDVNSQHPHGSWYYYFVHKSVTALCILSTSICCLLHCSYYICNCIKIIQQVDGWHLIPVV